MNFDEWCESKQIKGNWKEALYHSLAAKFKGLENIPENEDVWTGEWNVVLDRIMSKVMGTS